MNPFDLGFHPLFDAPELLFNAVDDGVISHDELLDFLVNRDDFVVTRLGSTYIAQRIKPQNKSLENGDFSKVSTKPVDINNIISDIENALEENNA